MTSRIGGSAGRRTPRCRARRRSPRSCAQAAERPSTVTPGDRRPFRARWPALIRFASLVRNRVRIQSMESDLPILPHCPWLTSMPRLDGSPQEKGRARRHECPVPRGNRRRYRRLRASGRSCYAPRPTGSPMTDIQSGRPHRAGQHHGDPLARQRMTLDRGDAGGARGLDQDADGVGDQRHRGADVFVVDEHDRRRRAPAPGRSWRQSVR